jgi:putative DNA primase/helicase
MSHARHEKFIVLVGAGANGKSVLLSILQSLCGLDNVAAVQPSNFDRAFQRAHLEHKLANIISEIPQGSVIADAELKAITSGDPSTVEHKYGAPFVMHPFSTCWFGTNHMPRTKDFSEALFRRAIIITFNRVFSSHEQDPNLRDAMKAELPGILVIALEAYAKGLLNGFTEPPSSKRAKQEWRLEVDQVAQFVEEVCQRDPKSEESIGSLFDAYRSWAVKEGIHLQMSKRGLRERLTRLGFGDRRASNCRYVTGISLSDDFG